ncbi:hypothetical protein TanjilG_04031 [Lupinus angustifolius]|uniref:Uncharacterized protein n=1 Tax=Lupinus angustifolius TaxID=3871 RepID=A0A394C702_LUPAN|nr:PREDICTED: uncharacterized protein LOC109353486 [Lupinus angustifolius]XP_019451333.1 PREDICTED: uncharacterized protein LOC109353488 [Lupinus angustifolius]OIW06635.1 hypothetical protein TanjilG_04029 [Lupinus angustifolius]OIW06637.1 hypothetical protein TanjilG_04031 [Lupinus angustifolius]
MNETLRKKHVREAPSVPFLWEVKPGIPKKDWKPEVEPSVTHFPKTPLKQIASVPFVWEEKPGTPLPNYHFSVPLKPHAMLIHVASSSGNSVAFNYSSSDESQSINSTMGLANCLELSAKVSNAIPVNGNSFCNYSCDQLQTPLSPTSSETDSSTSSYATGISSPVGVSFLESLFPLYIPKTKRDVHSEKVVSSIPKEQSPEDNNISDMVRRPPTLEELIMMSRRRSNRRKAFQKWDPPKKMKINEAFGCCSFVTNSNMIEGLIKRKYFPRLKLA